MAASFTAAGSDEIVEKEKAVLIVIEYLLDSNSKMTSTAPSARVRTSVLRTTNYYNMMKRRSVLLS